jgi:LPPG:FO 2-phospho-L-lactate transferase
VLALTFQGAEQARPAAGVLEALGEAKAVVIAPSNPLVSIGPILAVPGLRDVLAATTAPLVAISPIIGGKALKGPADRMLASLGHEVSAVGVAKMYADFLDVMVIDSEDAGLAPEIERLGVRTVVTNTVMRDAASRRALAETVVAAAR